MESIKIEREQYLQSKMEWQRISRFDELRSGGYYLTKAARSEHLSRKRLVKLLMATGKRQRNAAEALARHINRTGHTYSEWWWRFGDRVIWDIEHRYPAEQRLLKIIFGENYRLKEGRAEMTPERREAAEREIADEIAELQAIQDKHPKINDSASAKMALPLTLRKYSVPTGEVDEYGTPVRRTEDHEGLKRELDEIHRLIVYYCY